MEPVTAPEAADHATLFHVIFPPVTFAPAHPKQTPQTAPAMSAPTKAGTALVCLFVESQYWRELWETLKTTPPNAPLGAALNREFNWQVQIYRKILENRSIGVSKPSFFLGLLFIISLPLYYVYELPLWKGDNTTSWPLSYHNYSNAYKSNMTLKVVSSCSNIDFQDVT